MKMSWYDNILWCILENIAIGGHVNFALDFFHCIYNPPILPSGTDASAVINIDISMLAAVADLIIFTVFDFIQITLFDLIWLTVSDWIWLSFFNIQLE